MHTRIAIKIIFVLPTMLRDVLCRNQLGRMVECDRMDELGAALEGLLEQCPVNYD